MHTTTTDQAGQRTQHIVSTREARGVDIGEKIRIGGYEVKNSVTKGIDNLPASKGGKGAHSTRPQKKR